MFDSLKRKAAAKAMGVSDKQMAEMQAFQREMSEMQIRHEEDGIVIKLTGDMKVEYVEINGEAREDIKKAFNKAQEKMQKELTRKMMGMGGGLGGLLGNMKG